MPDSTGHSTNGWTKLRRVRARLSWGTPNRSDQPPSYLTRASAKLTSWGGWGGLAGALLEQHGDLHQLEKPDTTAREHVPQRPSAATREIRAAVGWRGGRVIWPILRFR